MPALLRRLLPLCLGLFALTVPALAQREGGGPPTQDPFGRPPAPVRAIGRYRSHQYAADVLTIRSTNGSTLRLRRWAAGVIRVEYYPAGQPPRPDSSLSVVQRPQDTSNTCDPGCDGPASAARQARYGPDICNGVLVQPDAIEFLHDCYRVIIQKNPLRVSYQRDGRPVVEEAGGAFEQLGAAGGTGVSFRLGPDEHLYGTGSRALPLDRRGRQLSLYNEAHYGYQDGEPTLNATLPTVLSSRGYMLFFDHHTAGTLDLGATRPDVLEYRGEGLRGLGYFIVAGDTYAEILSRYTTLTGRQPLPPRWGLGLIQSRFGYRSETELYQVARRMRQAGFPLDGLVLDLYWFGGTTRQGDFSWDAANFPNPKRLTRRLDSLGIKTVLISEPYVMRTSRHDALVRQRGLVERDASGQPHTVASFWAGPATLLDMYRPGTRRWLWEQYARLHQDGVRGWWTDLGEPENHPADMHSDGGPTRRAHNGYGQRWASILSEGYARHYPEERLLNLARSGWAGMQRHAVFPWSGDVSRSWAGLQAQVPIMLSMGLGGVGYMHSDAGGFAQGTPDPELYARWLQLAAFGPVLRPHGSGEIAPEPYWWPPATQAAVREAVRLRYQLLPYLYSLAWENTQTGTPLARPLNFGATYLLPESVLDDDPGTAAAPAANELSAEERAAGLLERLEQDSSNWPPPPARDPQPVWNWNTTASSPWGAEQLRAKKQREFAAERDSTLANVNDQFFLGPSLLVAPVLQPGQRRRNVVLPAGHWLDFHTHATYAGGQIIGYPAPLGRVPLLVRAGAFVPMTRYRPSTANYRADTLRVRYYADPAAGPGSFAVYEDDGRSAQAGARGQFALLTLQGRTTATTATVQVQRVGQPFAGAPTRRVVELLIPRVVAAPTAVRLAGQPLPDSAWQHDAAARLLRLRFALDSLNGPATTVTITGLRFDLTPASHAEPEALTLEVPAARTFRGRTELRYTRHRPDLRPAPLRIVDSRGGLVGSLPTEGAAGVHRLAWDARDAQDRPLPGGVYWAELAGQRQRLVVLPPQP